MIAYQEVIDVGQFERLAEYGVATLALLAVIVFALIMFLRSRSDNGTMKMFADLLTSSYKDVRDKVDDHDEESATRHIEYMAAVKTQSELAVVQSRLLREIAEITSKLLNNDNSIKKSVKDLSANVGAYTAKVEEVSGNIMEKVTPLDEVLTAIHQELKLLRQSVDMHLNDSTKFRDDVIVKTKKMEERLFQVEKRATQETPKINKETPVIPNPISDTKEEKPNV